MPSRAPGNRSSRCRPGPRHVLGDLIWKWLSPLVCLYLCPPCHPTQHLPELGLPPATTCEGSQGRVEAHRLRIFWNAGGQAFSLEGWVVRGAGGGAGGAATQQEGRRLRSGRSQYPRNRGSRCRQNGGYSHVLRRRRGSAESTTREQRERPGVTGRG